MPCVGPEPIRANATQEIRALDVATAANRHRHGARRKQADCGDGNDGHRGASRGQARLLVALVVLITVLVGILARLLAGLLAGLLAAVRILVARLAGVSPDFSLTVATRVTDASLPAASLTVYTNVYAPGLLASTVSPDTFTAPVTSPSTSSTAFTPAIGSNDAPNSTATSSAPEITGGTVSTGSASFTVPLNVAVSEVSAAYVTVMVFSPAVDESNSETVYSPSPSSAVCRQTSWR